jgi:hypothetical protein
MVQLPIRSTEVLYAHESCAMAAPAASERAGWCQILEAIENAQRHHADPRAARLGGDNIPARCCGASGEFAVPTRSRATSTSGAPSWSAYRARGCPSTRPSLEGILAPSTCTPHTPARRGGARMSTELVRVTIDERDVHVPKGTGMIETALAGGIEIPSSATSRGSARRSAPAGCASSRSRGCRSSRPRAR